MLPARDVAALRDNFLQHSDTIYIAGRKVCRQVEAQNIHIFRSGPYSVDGSDIIVNGRRVADGDTISLSTGANKILYQQGACVKLWALDQVPMLPEDFPPGPIAGGF